MRSLLVATVAALMLAAGAAAMQGEPMSVLQAATMKTYNQRLALQGEGFRISLVRCISESQVSAYCVGYLVGRSNGVNVGGWRYAWNVTLGSDGYIHWAAPRVLSR